MAFPPYSLSKSWNRHLREVGSAAAPGSGRPAPKEAKSLWVRCPAAVTYSW
jgi:hypothetical protein